ncbi:putative F-box protein at4g05475 [Phtheirospermum japonicum]|uniref:Putative F-box protein at4g05475 n=1 Tax=Phtheirospermum japonicum TaxID=374723 RepID=A0A830D0D0_9LAMI|nr:putative F-box protein at4g05475 [Phtheirospermum japonicum]
MLFITAGDIEAINISFPMLKSFTFNNRAYKFPHVEINDSYVLTIAKNMANLRHLCLFGNRLSNDRPKAIFDGCPNLESLDLHQCFSVDLRGDFDKICSERIKDLKRPFDSIADYEWDDMIYDDEVYWNDSSDDPYSVGYYEDYEDYEYYENYNDYTNPFNDLPFPANLAWYDMNEDDYL